VNKNKIIVFLHIPKTAGSTILSIFKQQYKGKKISVLDGSDPEKSKLNLFDNKDTYCPELIFGHTDYGIHEQYCVQEYQYFAFVRHPVERIISHYLYVKRSPNHYLHDFLDMSQVSLYDYVTSGATNELNNGQVRMLIGAGGFHKNNYAKYEVPYGKSEDWMLEEAKKNIEKYFGFVGVQEEFDNSILLLKKVLHWKKPLYYQSLNKTKAKLNKLDLDKKTLEAIVMYNALDLKLYDWVKSNFNGLKRKYPLYLFLARVRLLGNNWFFKCKRALKRILKVQF